MGHVFAKEAGFNLSIAWDTMALGWTSEGIHRQVSTMMEEAALCQMRYIEPLAIPHIGVIKACESLVSTFSLGLKEEEANQVKVRGLLPSLRVIVDNDIREIEKVKRLPHVSIEERPDSENNKTLRKIDPDGSEGFSCMSCKRCLYNMYMHCNGCEIQRRDFNLCVDCYSAGRHKQYLEMAELKRKDSYLQHAGHFDVPNHPAGKTCHKGALCARCSRCTMCACNCHRSFNLHFRYMTVDDLCRLHNSACEFVGKGLPQYGEEFVARMANHATAFSIAVSASAEQDVSIVDTNASVSVGEGDELPGEQDTSSVHADASTSELAEESQGLQEQGEGNAFDVVEEATQQAQRQDSSVGAFPTKKRRQQPPREQDPGASSKKACPSGCPRQPYSMPMTPAMAPGMFPGMFSGMFPGMPWVGTGALHAPSLANLIGPGQGPTQQMPQRERVPLNEVPERDVPIGSGAPVRKHKGNMRYMEKIKELAAACHAATSSEVKREIVQMVIEYAQKNEDSQGNTGQPGSFWVQENEDGQGNAALFASHDKNQKRKNQKHYLKLDITRDKEQITTKIRQSFANQR